MSKIYYVTVALITALPGCFAPGRMKKQEWAWEKGAHLYRLQALPDTEGGSEIRERNLSHFSPPPSDVSG